MTTRRGLLPRSVVLATTAVLIGATALPALASTPDPTENKKAGPGANKGYYLYDPQPTAEWHGCTRTSSHVTRVPREDGQPDLPKGNKQSYVTFTSPASGPLLTWKVRHGYTICGVEASVSLEFASDPGNLLLSEIGYTSGATSGSTSTAAGRRENIKVKVAKDSGSDFKGKTGSVYEVYDVTVFIKKA